jgi:hypothetical protein
MYSHTKTNYKMKSKRLFQLPAIGSSSVLSLSILIITSTFFSGCATIVSKTNWPLAIDSKPEGAQVSIVNRKGKEVYSGRTPAVTTLKSGSGFFGKESYTVTLTHRGVEKRTINVECKVNGWYFGNLLIGGLIGFLIVDPATGAMYRLEKKDIYETFTEDKTSQLKILDVNSVPVEWKACLVEL